MPADPVVIRDWAQAVEDLGYSHILAYDHVLGAVHENREPRLMGPYTEQDGFHEVLVLLAYLAACTSRVELASGVLILPQRQTALVAKQAAQLQILSQNRLRLGVGTGWNHVEYDSLGEDFKNRGARIDEQVALLRALWHQPLVDFTGIYHRVERAGLSPLPNTPIPIWFGGFQKVAFRRAARIGDGFIFGSGLKENLHSLDLLHTELDKAGREPSDFGTEVLVNHQSGDARWQSDIETLTARKVDCVSMRIDSPERAKANAQSPEEVLSILENYWEAVSGLASSPV